MCCNLPLQLNTPPFLRITEILVQHFQGLRRTTPGSRVSTRVVIYQSTSTSRPCRGTARSLFLWACKILQGLQRQRRAPRSFSKKSGIVSRILHPGCHVPDVRCCFCLSIRRAHDHSDPNSSDSAKTNHFENEQFRLAENNTSARPKDGVNQNAPTTCGSVGIRGDRREINR